MCRMDFGRIWMKVINVCVFSSRIYVLVHGRPIKDFQVWRGLQQSDPLSPFLFLSAVEGLTGLMRNAL